MVINLEDKKILVTGASSGIGRATAVLLSQLDATVILTARNEQNLKETISMMKAPVKHNYFVCDLSIPDNGSMLVQKSIEADNIKLDGVVHCAGCDSTIPLNMLDYKKMDAVMRINFYSFIEIVKTCSKKKYSNEQASIVGISSLAVSDGVKGQSIYAASKAAMNAAVLTLAKELASKKIRINAIMPATIETPMLELWAKKQGLDAVNDLLVRRHLGIGDAQDVANLAVFLLSSASKYITGESLALSGGGINTESIKGE